MRCSQAIQEEEANRGQIPAPNTQKGSQVWLDSRHIRTTRPALKSDWERSGPFTVVRLISPYACELELPASIRTHQVQPVSLFDLVANDLLIGQWLEWPPWVEVDGKEKYQVSSMEASWVYQNQLQYLMRWTGCGSFTWEPAKYVDGLQAVGKFHQRYPGKPGLLGNVLGEPQA